MLPADRSCTGQGLPAHTKLSNGCRVCIADADTSSVRQVLPSSQRTRSPSCSVHLELHKTSERSSSSRSVPANIGARTVTQPVSPFSVLPCSVTHHLACGTRQEPFTGHDSEHPLRCSGMEPALPPPPPGPSPQHICS